MGLAFCVLGWRFASTEWAFDRFHKKADRIHRVYLDFVRPDGERLRSADVPAFGLGPVLQARAPEVEATVRLASSRGISPDDYLLRVTEGDQRRDENVGAGSQEEINKRDLSGTADDDVWY